MLTGGGLGLFSRLGGNLQTAVADAGMSDQTASAAADAGHQSLTSAIWLLVVGAWLVVWFGWGVLRALWLVHAAAWKVDPPHFRRIPQGVAGTVAVPFALVLLSGAATWLRSHVGVLPGLVATILVGVVLGGFWFWVQTRLPHEADAPPSAFIPGTLAVTAGFEGIHLFSVYFLTGKLESASNLYGVLGLASTMLFVFFMLGRIIVWGAELNAVAWDVRRERHTA